MVVFLLAVLLAVGCGTLATVRPLPSGTSSLSLSAGGPVARFEGTVFPALYPVVRYRYGLSSRTTLNAGLHPLMAALGVVGTEAGVTRQLLGQSGLIPALGLGAGVLLLARPGGEARLFPQFDVCASYLPHPRTLAYLGCKGMFQPDRRPAVALTPFVGSEARLGRRFSLAFETGWYGACERLSVRRQYYPLPVAGRGALGFALGASWNFGG